MLVPFLFLFHIISSPVLDVHPHSPTWLRPSLSSSSSVWMIYLAILAIFQKFKYIVFVLYLNCLGQIITAFKVDYHSNSFCLYFWCRAFFYVFYISFHNLSNGRVMRQPPWQKMNLKSADESIFCSTPSNFIYTLLLVKKITLPLLRSYVNNLRVG